MEMFCICACLVIGLASRNAAVKGQDCSSSVGLESATIRDEQMKAPSWLYFDKSYTLYYRPYYGRLNYKKGGGSWCSEETEKLPDQYLEIDLGRNIRLTSVATQGRHGGSEYVDLFGITYKRNGDTAYRKHTEGGQWKIMKGNNDTDSIVKNVFTQPFIARWIRLVPRGSLFTIYCLRAELYGCEWKKSKDDLLLYTSHIGFHDQSNDYRDVDYDGTISRRLGLVTNGLGRLTDDVYGGQQLPVGGVNSKWVGFDAKRPVISFKFAKARIFHSVIFHVYNQRSNIRIFSKVDIEVSLSGVNFTLIASRRTRDVDRTKVGPLLFRVNLGGVISRFIKCRMSQLGTMVLLSEVDFTSEPFAAISRTPMTTDDTSMTATPDDATTTPIPEVTTRKAIRWVLGTRNLSRVGTTVHGQNRPNKRWGKGLGASAGDTEPTGLSFPIIIAIALGSIVAAVVVVLLFVRECRRFRHRNKHRGLADGSDSDSKAASELLGKGRATLSFQGPPYGKPCGPNGPMFAPLKVDLL